MYLSKHIIGFNIFLFLVSSCNVVAWVFAFASEVVPLTLSLVSLVMITGVVVLHKELRSQIILTIDCVLTHLCVAVIILSLILRPTDAFFELFVIATLVMLPLAIVVWIFQISYLIIRGQRNNKSQVFFAVVYPVIVIGITAGLLTISWLFLGYYLN